MRYEIKEPIFGNWYIEEEIGSGAFGTVYKIKREDFGRAYYSALKVIHIPQSQSELRSARSEFEDDRSLSDYYSNFVQDFAKEIEVMSELKGNSNIVSFEDHAFIKNDDGISWTILIRMELLTPFVEYQRENALENQDVVKLGIDICSALERCEKRNIIHRDIKPDNIFLSKDGDYELGDFGIARELEKTTGGLSKKGTYSYMAPEVYQGKPYNNTVDIYSLGIVMYKLLNRNRAPFMPEFPNPIAFSDREKSLQKRMSGEEIPDIKDIPKLLNDIVKKACAFDAKERYQSASDLKQALIDAVESDAPTVNANETVDANHLPIESEPPVTEDEITESTVGPFSEPVIPSFTEMPQNNENTDSERTVMPLSPLISAKSEQPDIQVDNSSSEHLQKVTKDSIINSFKMFFINYANFKGKTNRADFWSAVIANMAVFVVLLIIARFVGPFRYLFLAYCLAMILPSIALAVRRLHDIGKSGTNALYLLIPIVGAIILIIWFTHDSQTNMTEYSENKNKTPGEHL